MDPILNTNLYYLCPSPNSLLPSQYSTTNFVVIYKCRVHIFKDKHYGQHTVHTVFVVKCLMISIT
jgi:hypothetical protein